ncbi:hypothetical protein [Agromyces mariniharenae]|uniref:Uncharacterized protein n=1 Tax=Agromyces mariniharenae TaxID=2604423 RepID=A0A5S4V4U4_9MICO|nr:hypothetical protein [Agromyces mariniharenae]TYL54012.1 hypothetical protein FYC51_10465 [Agromyces mariniharenae]
MKSEPPTGDELARLLVSMKRNVLERVAQEPAPARRMSTHRILGLGLGVAALFGVGAGAAFALGMFTGPQEDPTTTTDAATAPPSAPAPSEYAVTAGQPASRYGLDCATLVDPSRVSNLFSTDVAAVDPILSESGVGIAIPRRAAILAVGGTVCEWSNGVAMNDQYGTEPDYVGVTISVVPRPVEGWSEVATQHGMPADERECGDTWCWASVPVGDAWVTVAASAGDLVTDASGWSSLVDAVVASVAAAGPAAPPTIPERTAMPVSEDCEAIIPLDEVRTITATPDAQAMLGAGGWSEWAEARLIADAWGCGWGVDDLSRVARVDWLHEGRWAYLRMLQAGTSTPIQLDGLAAGDAASVRCDDRYGTTCAVDLAVGRDWYNVTANDESTAMALAEALVARLAG